MTIIVPFLNSFWNCENSSPKSDKYVSVRNTYQPPSGRLGGFVDFGFFPHVAVLLCVVCGY